MRFRVIPLVRVIPLALTLGTSPVRAEHPVTTLATLLSRAQIEDLLVDYYALFGGADRGFGSYYTEDGVLDVNGIVRRGRGPIDDLYKGIPAEAGKIHILISNPQIVVNGATATADLVWTEYDSETHLATPHILEQGREHDELIKRSGRWYLKYRVVTNDGGLPPSLEKYYKKR
jgi:hypothetical protein